MKRLSKNLKGLLRSATKVSLIGLLSSVLIISLSTSFKASAQGAQYVGPVPNASFKTGRVIARSVIINPDTNEPILVEFDASGNEVREANTDRYRTSELIIYPAASYRRQVQRLNDFLDEQRDNLAIGAEVLSARQFEQRQFVAADNSTVIPQQRLDESIKSVLVRGPQSRIISANPELVSNQNPNDLLVLLEFDVDLSQRITIDEQSLSLLVDPDGQVVTQSENTIGYRVGFFGDPNEPQDNLANRRIGPDDTVFGPVPFTKVSVDEFAYRGGVDVSGNDGRYSFTFFMPLCPVGGFEFTTDVTAELRYRNFLPTGAPSIPYFVRTPGFTYCTAFLVPPLAVPSVQATLATQTVPNIQSNLIVDVMFVNGNIVLRNPMGELVEVGDTTYTAFETPPDQTTQTLYDFNGDSQSDTVIQGRVLSCTLDEDPSLEPREAFLADDAGLANPLAGSPGEVVAGYTCSNPTAGQGNLTPEDGGNWQGVYFDGQQSDVFDFPDLVRVIDRELRNEPIGVLKSLSREDLANTDVLFFREATGQIILERRGLKPEEANFRRSVEYDEQENEVAYRVMLRGNRDSSLNVGGGVNRRQSFEDWATDYQLAEPFRQRESDQPRPGEFIKIVAINRATGYTGTARVQLQSAGQNGTGLLDVVAPTITLRPPNLRIWAERDYEVEQGLTAGEERNFTIGNEGASLLSDNSIRVYTEWFDEFGRPLPEELGLDNGAQYGLTGRLAKVVGENQLRGDGVSSDMAEFPIGPGRNTQVLRPRGLATGTEHFYIHVIGKPREQECVSQATCASFNTPSQDPNFAGRPELITPFLTPLYDESEDWRQTRAFREAQDNFEQSEDENAQEPIRPAPAYAWQYRPEYQFSQFDLEVQAINRASEDENGQVQETNILDATNPTIASSDDYLETLYSIISSEFEPLSPIDGPRELVLEIGGQEQRVTIGEDQSIRFENLESLASLDSEDFLSLRLYTNNDAGNVLWEYAFGSSLLFPQRDTLDGQNQDIQEISADLAVVTETISLLLEPSLPEVQVSWDVFGNGSLFDTQNFSQNGFYSASLNLGTKAGNQTIVQASIADENRLISPIFKVVPGIASEIKLLSRDGATTIGGLGLVTVELEVLDQFNNFVADGTEVEVSAPDLELVSQTATLGGKAIFEFSGIDSSGELPVQFSVGNARLESSVFVSDVAIEILGLNDVEVNDSITLEIVAESDLTSLENLELDIVTSRGKLNSNRLSLDESNRVSVVLSSGDFRGHGQLALKIVGTTRFFEEEFLVLDNQDWLSSNVLVTGGSGEISFSTDSNSGSLSYSANTDLFVSTTAGDEVVASLANIFMPPLYPLIDYDQDFPQTSPTRLIDLSSGLDAQISNLEIDSSSNGQTARVIALNSSSKIILSSHSRTQALQEAGVNFLFRLNDLSEVSGEETLLEWNDLGIRLFINQSGSLIVRSISDQNVVELESENALEAGRWTQIAAHFYDGSLHIGLGDQVTSINVSQLERFEDEIGFELSGLNGAELAALRIYDWNGDAKVAFDDGTFSARAFADQGGMARINFNAIEPVVAYQQLYKKREPTFVAIANQLLLQDAHAQNESSFRDRVAQCREQFLPVPDGAPDPLIAEAERFLNLLLECFVKSKIEQVQIEYEKESGFFRKTALIVERELYEGTYEVLKFQARNSLAVVNCLDAALSGSNSSAVGFACDVITSFFAIGDIRDLLIQSWLWFIDSEDYDPLVAGLAGIGLAADALSLTGIGSAPGIIINTLSATAKPVARAFRAIGDAGRRAAQVFGEQIEQIAKLDASIVEKANRLRRFVPIMGILAQVSFIRNQSPEVFEFLTHAITSPETLSNLARWFERYQERLEQELIGANHWSEKFLNALVGEAYAIASGAQRQILRHLQRIVDIGEESVDNIPPQRLADSYNEAINSFVRLLDEMPNSEIIGTAAKESVAIEAFVKVHEIGGRDLVESLSRLTGVNGFGLGNTINGRAFTQTDFLAVIAALPIRQMSRAIGVDNLRTQLSTLLRKTNSSSFNIAKGSNFQLLQSVNRILRGGDDVTTSGFEKAVPIEFVSQSGDIVKFQKRIYDEYFQVAGKTFYREAKAWSRDYAFGEGLRRSLRNTGQITNEGIDPPGQLVRDLAEFTRNGGEFNVKWVFSPEILVDARRFSPDDIASGKHLSPENIARVRGELAETVGELMVNDSAIRTSVQRALDLTDLDTAAWQRFVFGRNNRGGFVDRLAENLFEIDNLGELTKILQ